MCVRTLLSGNEEWQMWYTTGVAFDYKNGIISVCALWPDNLSRSVVVYSVYRHYRAERFLCVRGLLIVHLNWVS